MGIVVVIRDLCINHLGVLGSTPPIESIPVIKPKNASKYAQN